jgi:hypothetical protein
MSQKQAIMILKIIIVCIFGYVSMYAILIMNNLSFERLSFNMV